MDKEEKEKGKEGEKMAKREKGDGEGGNEMRRAIWENWRNGKDKPAEVVKI